MTENDLPKKYLNELMFIYSKCSHMAFRWAHRESPLNSLGFSQRRINYINIKHSMWCSNPCMPLNCLTRPNHNHLGFSAVLQTSMKNIIMHFLVRLLHRHKIHTARYNRRQFLCCSLRLKYGDIMCNIIWTFGKKTHQQQKFTRNYCNS